ncbi:hypothetical protein RFI_05012 [Reticulomyxa filosa]|uniref:Large ribosomal subunit protein uL2 C-terminal domain-containing protein n=1 Tax=Reticulomyxa filosa TaxID=46433 RepID=X6P209_RETFI|nr:hypothetical protein RFI_05012 [Reticulomyxa filosa]|eukprot:ETO32104.1 hypothetical protein RFI_05012 [Reticulomyxa filosa]
MALIQFKNPIKYRKQAITIAAPEGMYTGQYVRCGKRAPLAVGNILPVGKCPEGTLICNLESRPGDRGSYIRASGTVGSIIAQTTSGKTVIRLPSGQKKVVKGVCRAMVGVVAGGGRPEKPIMKAGRAYWKAKAKRRGWPKVRGVAMNPVEHPHGGGNHQHVGKPTTVSRKTTAGRKVGLIAARRTGRKLETVTKKLIFGAVSGFFFFFFKQVEFINENRVNSPNKLKLNYKIFQTQISRFIIVHLCAAIEFSLNIYLLITPFLFMRTECKSFRGFMFLLIARKFCSRSNLKKISTYCGTTGQLQILKELIFYTENCLYRTTL